MKKRIFEVLTAIDFGVLAVSASCADSESVIPVIVCLISTALLIPLALILKEGDEDGRDKDA